MDSYRWSPGNAAAGQKARTAITAGSIRRVTASTPALQPTDRLCLQSYRYTRTNLQFTSNPREKNSFRAAEIESHVQPFARIMRD